MNAEPRSVFLVAAAHGVPSEPFLLAGLELARWGEDARSASSPLARLPILGTRPNHPNCGKLVKLFAYGTEVLSLITRHLHANPPKDIWRVYSLILVF